jgi:predicted porin
MKKTLIALAALASVSAFAQSSVTLSGSVAAGIQNTAAASNHKARFNLTDADINFKAVEDLGGGLTATSFVSITAEGLRSNAATIEKADISLAGGFGKVYYGTFLSGASKLSAGISAEDDMSDAMGGYTPLDYFSYTTPELTKGLTFGVEIVYPQAASAGVSSFKDVIAANSKSQVLLSAEPGYFLNYTNGPVWAYLGMGKNPSNNTSAWDVRGSYDLGAAKVAGRMTDANGTSGRGTELAVTAPMGATTLGMHFVKRGEAKGTGFSAVYALSKNTSINASYVKGTDNDANVSGFTGNNYRVQLNQKF